MELTRRQSEIIRLALSRLRENFYSDDDFSPVFIDHEPITEVRLFEVEALLNEVTYTPVP